MMVDSEKKHRSLVSSIAFTAVAAIVAGLGGLVKLPSPIGSVAFDSAPGFFAAAFYSPLVGGAVGFLGHLLSAAAAGFPAGILHLLIGGGMFVCCWTFGFIARRINKTWGLLPASLAAVAINNAIPFFSVALGAMKLEAALALIFPFLLAASALNVAVACGVLIALRKLRVANI